MIFSQERLRLHLWNYKHIGDYPMPSKSIGLKYNRIQNSFFINRLLRLDCAEHFHSWDFAWRKFATKSNENLGSDISFTISHIREWALEKGPPICEGIGLKYHRIKISFFINGLFSEIVREKCHYEALLIRARKFATNQMKTWDVTSLLPFLTSENELWKRCFFPRMLVWRCLKTTTSSIQKKKKEKKKIEQILLLEVIFTLKNSFSCPSSLFQHYLKRPAERE